MTRGDLCSMKSMVGEFDFLLITLDTLRFDAAQTAWSRGLLPTLSAYLGEHGWECRHSPASFTYAAHHAFFAGFLPTPIAPGLHSRLYASRFGGSETTTEHTFVFDQATLPEALATCGYRTICVGGTGFFNPATTLGTVLPALFDEAYWDASLGVTDRGSEVNQIGRLVSRLKELEPERTFSFVNVSAIHQPNWFYGDQKSEIDSLQSHTAALVAVDRALARLFDYCKTRRPTFCIVCSDHGTAYGEDGYFGHRLAHEVIWNVPYAEFVI